MPTSPRDRYVTIYGRMPVAEALETTAVPLARLFVADNARGEAVERILAAAVSPWRWSPRPA